MITTSAEYLANLYRIQDANKPDTTFRLPSDENTYVIDLNTRTIKAPTYLSVAKDHVAEIVYFEIDRIFDTVDLSQLTCIVQYINAQNEGAIYPVPYYDITTKEGKIIFPWAISGNVTAAPGTVKFSVRFYKLDENRKVLYNISTLAASSKILYGMDLSDELEDQYNITGSILDEINQRLAEFYAQAEIYWINADATQDTEIENNFDFIESLLPNTDA